MRRAELKNLRVLVVDDSPLIRSWIGEALAPHCDVVGTAAEGQEAIARTVELAPDVITMDLRMPGTDGFGAIAGIMAVRPTPILVLTAEPEEPNTFRALSLGALDLLQKPETADQRQAFGAELARRLRLLAGAPVIRHVRGLRAPVALPVARAGGRPEVVAIAASLGGPRALGRLLKALPHPFPLPVVVVQHMAEGFTTGLTRWLSMECAREVREAVDGEALLPGPVLFAPAGSHLLVERERVRLEEGPPQHGFRPSATPLFRTVARSFGAAAVGVILTGMGNDGADGLLELHRTGALTLAQDEASCAVFGMPRAAIQAGAVSQVLPLERIGAVLAELGAPLEVAG